MKGILTILLSGLVCFSANAQSCEGVPLVAENFNAATIPGSWTILDLDGNTLYWNMPSKGYTGAWQPFQHSGRQCVANTSRFVPSGTSDDYLITPQITLGITPVCLSWKGAVFSTNFMENYEVRISTTTPDAAGMQANPALISVNNDSPDWTQHIFDLSAYAGQTVYIGFWYNTNTQYAMYLDDIKITQPVNVDATITEVYFPDVILPSTQVISGMMMNGGLTAITSMDMNWQVDNGPVNTMNIPSFNVQPSMFYWYIHNVNWTPTANGRYALKIWASNVNGGQDQYTANDTLTQYVFVNNFPRKILIEEFTQASCPPCGTLNPGFDSIVQPNITNNNVTSIKYHCVWPGVDPMNAFNMEDVAERVQYYGINGIPIGLVDGQFFPANCPMFSGNPGCGQQIIDSAGLIPTIFDIQVSDPQIGNTMNISVTVTAKTDFPITYFRLYTVVVEDTIIYTTAPGTNGETEFPQVMRKILPDSTGQPLPAFTNNQSVTFNYSYPVDISNCVISEMRTVAFIQDGFTHHVYQSETTSPHTTGISDHQVKYNLKIFPNPTNGNFSVSASGIKEANVNWQLINIIGEKVLSGKFQTSNGTISETLDISGFQVGMYFLQLISGNEMMTVKIAKE